MVERWAAASGWPKRWWITLHHLTQKGRFVSSYVAHLMLHELLPDSTVLGKQCLDHIITFGTRLFQVSLV